MHFYWPLLYIACTLRHTFKIENNNFEKSFCSDRGRIRFWKSFCAKMHTCRMQTALIALQREGFRCGYCYTKIAAQFLFSHSFFLILFFIPWFFSVLAEHLAETERSRFTFRKGFARIRRRKGSGLEDGGKTRQTRIQFGVKKTQAKNSRTTHNPRFSIFEWTDIPYYYFIPYNWKKCTDNLVFVYVSKK